MLTIHSRSFVGGGCSGMSQKVRVKLTVVEEFAGGFHLPGRENIWHKLFFMEQMSPCCLVLLGHAFLIKWKRGCYSIVTGDLVFS